MTERILVLGAGFAGLELAAVLSDELGEDAGVTLVDDGEAFVFGYSKLDVLFGRTTLADARLPYASYARRGVRFVRETITGIDAAARQVTTDSATHAADVLVIALGAAYDFGATPGVAGNEFYSVAGAEQMRGRLAAFGGGRVVVGVCGAPFKCPPAPSEAAILLHDHLVERGLRDASEITLVMPFPTPVPPSPDASAALLAAFDERGIRFVPDRRVTSLDDDGRVARLDDGTDVPCDLFLGVPRHRAPDVVLESGLAVDGYVPVSSRTLETSHPDVYAVGDVAMMGVPKAGVLAERAARVVASSIVARRRGLPAPEGFEGRGSCFVEFGSGRVGRVDIDFSGATPVGTLTGPSAELVAEKREFGASRGIRWFGGAHGVD